MSLILHFTYFSSYHFILFYLFYFIFVLPFVQLILFCFVSNLPSVHNNTIVCLVDRDERTDKLVYLNQTERVTKTNCPVFRKKFPLEYIETAAKKLRFNVYDVPSGATSIEDPDRVGSAVVTLKECVDGAGTDFIFNLSHKDGKKQSLLDGAKSTITVNCFSKKEVLTAATMKMATEKDAVNNKLFHSLDFLF